MGFILGTSCQSVTLVALPTSAGHVCVYATDSPAMDSNRKLAFSEVNVSAVRGSLHQSECIDWIRRKLHIPMSLRLISSLTLSVSVPVHV